jgi:hypothetical protein
MKTLEQTDFEDFCSRSIIHLHGPELKKRIGNELSFGDCPLRTLVVHFAHSDPPEYVLKILRILLGIEDSWLLSPRFTYREDMRLFHKQFTFEILIIDKQDKSVFSEFLLEYLGRLKSISDDLFVIGLSGKVIVRYDHHIFSDGLSISLNDVGKAGSLLKALNDLGTELELFYCER